MAWEQTKRLTKFVHAYVGYSFDSVWATTKTCQDLLLLYTSLARRIFILRTCAASIHIRWEYCFSRCRNGGLAHYIVVLPQQFGRPHAGDYKLRIQSCIRAYHKACTHN